LTLIAIALLDGEPEQRGYGGQFVVLGIAREDFALLFVPGLVQPVPELPHMVGRVLVHL
jgi:hypothetical protein